MTEPRRLLEAEAVLPPELTRALNAAGSEPAQLELEHLASRLSAALGVPLAAPAAMSASSSAGVAAATKPLFSLGAWVLSGVVIGVGLSGVGAYTFAAFDGAKPPGATSAEVRHIAPAQASPSPTAAVSVPDRVAVSPVSSSAHPSNLPRAAGVESTFAPVPDGAIALEPQETELSLLRRAQEAINTNPSRALALSVLHDQAFPSGLLAQEREVIAIDALSRLGRVSEARARARRFISRYPGSAHAPRLRALLGESDSK